MPPTADIRGQRRVPVPGLGWWCREPCCGDGPLITGQPPGLGAQLAAPALDWMDSRGWQLHPRPLCPADHR